MALLALGFAVPGCGDDSGEDRASDDTPTAAAPAIKEQEGDDSDAARAPAPPQGGRASEDCKKQAHANPQLSAAAREKIREVCEEAAGGDAAGAFRASREACEIIVEETAPAGAGKQAALQACRQSAQTP